MSAKYAQLYISDQDEKHFKDWRNHKGGRVANLPSNHPALEVQKNIFLKQVEALKDISHLVKEPNYKQAFNNWNTFGFTEEDYPTFLDIIKSYEDPDPDQRDRDARAACEKYQETSEAKYFDAWLQHNQKLHIQALKDGKNIMQLQEKDKLYPEFIEWCKCPWKGDPYDFCIYLLEHPKGPSGYDNIPWGKTMMKCFYIGDNHWFHTCDRAHQERFVKDKEITLKPIQQMIKDLKFAQAQEKAQEGIEADPETDPETDLEKQLETLKKLQADLERKIAIKNEKETLKKLSPIYQNNLEKLNKKRSFHNLTWDYGELPPTDRAKKFKAHVNQSIKRVKDLEQQANKAREEAKKNIQELVQTFLK